ALGERLRLRLTGESLLLIETVDVGGDVFLILRELLGVLLQLLQIPIAAAALIPLEALLRVAEPVERLGRLRPAVARSVRRRAAHRVRRLLQLLDRVVHVAAALLIARELLQLARRLLELLGE